MKILRLTCAFFGFIVGIGVAIAQSNPPTPSGGKIDQQPIKLSQNDENNASRTYHGSQSTTFDAAKTIDGKSKSQQQRGETTEKPSEWWIVWLTIALVFVGLVQAGVYVWQALLINATLDHSRKSSEKQLRAYLGVIFPERGEECEDFPANFVVHVINAGQTPAYEVEGSAMWTTFDRGTLNPPSDFTYHLTRKGTASRFTLSPQKIAPIRFPLDPGENGITFESCLTRANKGEIVLFLYGTISYRDVFENTPVRTTNFCFRHMSGDLSKNRQQVVCRVHNETT